MRMKSFIVIFTVIIMFMCFPCNNSEGADWKFYYHLGKIDSVLYYDADSVVKVTDDIYRVWMERVKFKEIKRVSEKNRDMINPKFEAKVKAGYLPPYVTEVSAGMDYQIDKQFVIGLTLGEVTVNSMGIIPDGVALDEINCNTRMERHVTLTLYKPDGTSTSGDINSEWEYIVPNTASDSLRQILCKKH